MEEHKMYDMRQHLWCWGNVMETISRKRIEQERFKTWADDAYEMLHAQRLTGMPGGSALHDMTDTVLQIQKRADMYHDMEIQSDNEIKRLLDLKTEMDELVNALPMAQQQVVHLRYEGKHRYSYIAIKMGMTERNVFVLESKAVKRLCELKGGD